MKYDLVVSRVLGKTYVSKDSRGKLHERDLYEVRRFELTDEQAEWSLAELAQAVELRIIGG